MESTEATSLVSVEGVKGSLLKCGKEKLVSSECLSCL